MPAQSAGAMSSRFGLGGRKVQNYFPSILLWNLNKLILFICGPYTHWASHSFLDCPTQGAYTAFDCEWVDA